MSKEQRVIWIAASIAFAVMLFVLTYGGLPGIDRIEMNLFSSAVFGSVVATIVLLLRYWVPRNFDEQGNWTGGVFRRRK